MGFFLYLSVFMHTHADVGQVEAVGNTNSMDAEYSTAYLGEIGCSEAPKHCTQDITHIWSLALQMWRKFADTNGWQF